MQVDMGVAKVGHGRLAQTLQRALDAHGAAADLLQQLA